MYASALYMMSKEQTTESNIYIYRKMYFCTLYSEVFRGGFADPPLTVSARQQMAGVGLGNLEQNLITILFFLSEQIWDFFYFCTTTEGNRIHF